ncbi:MAG: VWA domain-containing protein, partial [Chloroflexi bacterium]|nr:VWA domain-containing protein [Chloroflexota bacterium]
VLDHSSSMGIDRSNEDSSPMLLAREAAMRAIETLREEDFLGVLSFSTRSTWDVPVQQLGDALGMRSALDAVSRVEASGSTYMYRAMEEAIDRVAQLPDGSPTNRHILVLSDGQSTDGTDERFVQLAERAHAQGITITTIALGRYADNEVMARIAEAGEGRFYSVLDANDLPRILISETQAARSENIQQGDTALSAGEPGHPILSGMELQELPHLSAYNALVSKTAEGAEDVLVSASFADPVLSTWQYGLGRVSAWTGDTGEEWTGAWPSPQAAGQFWSQVVRYSLVDPALGPAQVEIHPGPTALEVNAVISRLDGTPANLADVEFTLAGPEGDTRTFAMLQARPGMYYLELPRPADGAYRAMLTYTDEDGQPVRVPAPFEVNPPPEWLPQLPGTGRSNLAQWAASDGARLISPAELETPPQAETDTPATPPPLDWRWGLLLALVVAWPIEIAIRRRWLPWTR